MSGTCDLRRRGPTRCGPCVWAIAEGLRFGVVRGPAGIERQAGVERCADGRWTLGLRPSCEHAGWTSWSPMGGCHRDLLLTRAFRWLVELGSQPMPHSGGGQWCFSQFTPRRVRPEDPPRSGGSAGRAYCQGNV